MVSPGGVGFDISCGVRLLVSSLSADELCDRLPALMDDLDWRIPRGLGKGGVWQLRDSHELTAVLRGGSSYAVERGYGVTRDLERCEDRGSVADADPAGVSERARLRGLGQVGSLGSGNHFLEVQVVDRVFDEGVAAAFGLRLGGVCVMIHCGSRGLGHQICSDHVRKMLAAMPRYGIAVPDPQLACAPVSSAEGRSYLGAMAAAANYGRANRQLLTVAARRAFAATIPGVSLELLYDVSHNLAKLATMSAGSPAWCVCTARERPGPSPLVTPDLFPDLKVWGQPVLIPGSMGTASHVLVGVVGGGAFHSTCHGAGRTMSRHAATRKVRGRELRDQLAAAGIAVRAHSDRGLAEEAPFSYKDVDEVVATCEQAGLARRVARLRPLGVVKG